MIVRLAVAALLALSLFRAAPADPPDVGAVLAVVNAHRIAHGVAPLTRDSRLDVAALRHSTDMATQNFVNHTGSDGSRASDRISAAGYSWTAWGENIAAGHPTAQAVMASWMASAGHKANILNPRYREMGIAVVWRAGSRYGYYWTQVFGQQRSQPNPPDPPPTPIPPPPTPVPPPPPFPIPPGERPNLIRVTPRRGPSGVTTVTLTGNNFGTVRGTNGRVTMRKSATRTYAVVTLLSWSSSEITFVFRSPIRGYHFVQVVKGDGYDSIEMLFFVQ